MTTAAMIGYGSVFEVETAAGSGIFFELGEVTNITPPNASIDQQDATHMRSPSRTKESIAGLTDPGNMSVEMNHVPGSTTDDFILAWRAAGENRSCRITYPNAERDTFPANVQGYSTTLEVATILKATLDLKVAGAIVRS